MKIKQPHPNVSVIIPCYNCGMYINDALNSLQSQTYDDFDVICVNDGSTDETASILKKWEECGNLSMTVINQPNSGVSHARNMGLSIAKGKWVAFLDADDVYNRDFLYRLTNSAEKHNADTAYCDLSRDINSVINNNNNYNYYAEDVVVSSQTATAHLLHRMGSIGFCCFLYRSDLLKEKSILFDENTRHFEDREFNWKYLCHCKTIVCIQDAMYGYRINTDSVLHKKEAVWRTDSLEAVSRLQKYLEENQYPYATIVNGYLPYRVLWSMAKNYAQCGGKECFDKLVKEYPVKQSMIAMLKDDSLRVRISSLIYLISPTLFFRLVHFHQ